MSRGAFATRLAQCSADSSRKMYYLSEVTAPFITRVDEIERQVFHFGYANLPFG